MKFEIELLEQDFNHLKKISNIFSLSLSVFIEKILQNELNYIKDNLDKYFGELSFNLYRNKINEIFD